MLRVLQAYDIQVHKLADDEYRGACPFLECGKDNHFYCNTQRELWDCKRCGKHGNQYTLITELHKSYLGRTTDDDYAHLAEHRPGIQPEVFKKAEWAHYGLKWFVPYHNNGTGFLSNLGYFLPRKGYRIFKGPGFPHKLYRPLDRHELEDNVVICEGEWDLLALSPHIPEGWSIVAVPGSHVFKEEFVPFFRGKNVYLCYDRDEAGKMGIVKAVNALNPVAESIKYLAWPDDYAFPAAGKDDKPGKDIRDLVAHNS